MKSSNRKISLILVPEGEGKTRSIRLSRSLISLLIWAAALFFIAVIAGGVSYYFLYKKAAEFGVITDENIKLREESRRIMEIAQDLEKLKNLEGRIRRSLGSSLGIDTVLNSASIEAGFSDEWTRPSVPLLVKPKFTAPVEGLISRGFSEGIFPKQTHRGIDFAVPVGTIVNASAAGWVVFTDWHFRYGNLLIIQHPGDYLSLYGHNNSILVGVGEQIEAGQPVAVSGNTGHSTAPHLHFEIRLRGKAVDPSKFIQELRETTALSSEQIQSE